MSIEKEREKVDRIMAMLIHDNQDKADQAVEKPSLKAWFVGRIYHHSRTPLPRSIVEEVVEERLNYWVNGPLYI